MPAAKQVPGMPRKMRHALFSCRTLQSGAKNKTSAQKPQCKVESDREGGLENCAPSGGSTAWPPSCVLNIVAGSFSLFTGAILYTVAPLSTLPQGVTHWPLGLEFVTQVV